MSRLSSPIPVLQCCCECQDSSSRSSRDRSGSPSAGGAATSGCCPHGTDTCAVPRTGPLSCAAHARCPPLPLCCNSGLVLMFPGQLWQGTVKGQSLNEPLWDLPQLLTISLPLIRQGSAAHAVSLHHFFPMPFPPACSTQTNQLSMKTQTGAFFLESSSSLALTQVSQVPINFHFFLPLLCLCLAGAELPVPNCTQLIFQIQTWY